MAETGLGMVKLDSPQIFIYFFIYLDRQIWGFYIFSVGYTPRPISMQNFKSAPLLEVV